MVRVLGFAVGGLTNRWSGRVKIKCQAYTSACAPLSSTVRWQVKGSRTVRSILTTSMFGSLALGGSLAGYTPIACGCLTPWEALAVFVRLPKDSWRVTTAAKIQDAFTRTYKDRRITLETLPPEGDCSMIANRQVRCTHWTLQKLDPRTGNMDLKGYELTILVTKSAIFESVHVDDIETPPQK